MLGAARRSAVVAVTVAVSLAVLVLVRGVGVTVAVAVRGAVLSFILALRVVVLVVVRRVVRLTRPCLSRRGVRVALARLSGREMSSVSEGASSRRVAAAPERAAGWERRRSRARLLDGCWRRDGWRRWFRASGCRGRGRRGRRRRRCRCGGRRGRGRAAWAGRSALAGRARMPASVPMGRVRGRAAGVPRGRANDALVRGSMRRLGDMASRGGLPVRAPWPGGPRRDDHLLWRRRRGVRSRAADPRQLHRPGVREQRGRGRAQQERNDGQRHSASQYPDCAPRAAFVGRHRPVPLSPTTSPTRT
jgi:hypothetical protein